MLDPVEWTTLEETDQGHTRMTVTSTGTLRLQVLKVEKEIALPAARAATLVTTLERALRAAAAYPPCSHTPCPLWKRNGYDPLS